MIIRAETPDDEHAIHRVTKAAFTNVSHTRGMEAQIVCKLRKDGDLRLSIVAEVNGKIVGHVAFSPITVAGRHDDWFGLGPVAVRPDMQRRGIGSALVTCGLTELRAAGAKGCALVGNPAFYERFGFKSDGMIVFRGLPARLVQRLVFVGDIPSGVLAYAPAFDLANPLSATDSKARRAVVAR